MTTQTIKAGTRIELHGTPAMGGFQAVAPEAATIARIRPENLPLPGIGWHIVKLEDVRDAQVPSLEEVKPQIQQRLGQQRLAEFRDQLKSRAKTDYKFN